MKRIVSLALLTILCIFVLAGCANGEGSLEFTFSYEVEKSVYTRGETVKITATVTNASGRAYRYTGCSGNDFFPMISLCHASDPQDQLEFEPIAFPTDVVNKKVEDGESGSMTYSFVIPADASLGSYDLTLWLGESKQEYSAVLSIVELTSQNENEKYTYSSTVIIAGGAHIKPIQTLVYTNEYAKDGQELLCGDGMGSYGVFYDPDTKLTDFPTLVANGPVTGTVPAKAKHGSPHIYDTNFEEVQQYSSPGWDGLHLLPAGEYVVVFPVTVDSRDSGPEEETYWITRYENIFRLIVPERELGQEQYSLKFNKTYALDERFDLNAKYRAGERVELRLELVYEQYYEIRVGDEYAVQIGSQSPWVIFAFIMPEGDAYVEITEVSVDIPGAP
ncbi:MAG: hypothetical protein IJF08_00840 [Clostridia bacterium]|nr:hypothetical protein [Clostridia bacterium]